MEYEPQSHFGIQPLYRKGKDGRTPKNNVLTRDLGAVHINLTSSSNVQKWSQIRIVKPTTETTDVRLPAAVSDTKK